MTYSAETEKNAPSVSADTNRTQNPSEVKKFPADGSSDANPDAGTRGTYTTTEGTGDVPSLVDRLLESDIAKSTPALTLGAAAVGTVASGIAVYLSRRQG